MKSVLHKHYSGFSKIWKNGVHLNQFLVLLYDCLPIVNYFLSIEKLLDNTSILDNILTVYNTVRNG